jgi:putative transposase
VSELNSLPESNRNRAVERFRILRPYLENGRTLASVAREAGIAYSTAQRWVGLFRASGLGALARKGTRVYSNVFDLIHRREVERPNQI